MESDDNEGSERFRHLYHYNESSSHHRHNNSNNKYHHHISYHHSSRSHSKRKERSRSEIIQILNIIKNIIIIHTQRIFHLNLFSSEAQRVINK